MIYKRHTKSGTTRYVVKVYVRTTSDGRKIDRHVGTFRTPKDAKIAEAQALQELHLAANDESIQQFSDRWLADYARPRASTMRTHRQAIKAFVEHYGQRKPSTITKKEARAWAKDHPASHAALRAMWTDMETEEIVSTNPFSNLRLPQSRGRADITPPTVGELDQLMQAARDSKKPLDGGSDRDSTEVPYGEKYASMIEFAAYTGIRRGELCVLTWGDIDFNASRVQISKTLSDDREILPPKNGKARTIVLPPRAADALRRIAPAKADPSSLIFTTPNGRRYTKSTWHYHWNPVRAAAGFPTLDWHVLRHFCATYMLETLKLSLGAAAAQVGHSDGGVLLMRVYAHLNDDTTLEEVATAFDQAQNMSDERDSRSGSEQRPALRVLEAAS